MNRDEILKQFKTNERGGIADPGKFEGEMLYVPYFYDKGMEGMADEDIQIAEGESAWIFTLTPEDHELVPELGEATELAIRNDSNGFIYGITDLAAIAQLRDSQWASLDEEVPEEVVTKELGQDIAPQDMIRGQLETASSIVEANEARQMIIQAMGYTDLAGQVRASFLLGQAGDKLWKSAVAQIKKRHGKDMKDRVANLVKWGTVEPSPAAVKDVIAKVLIENGISAYPNLIEALYSNPFQDRAIGADNFQDQTMSEPR